MSKPSYRVLFLMDPYKTLNLETETSLLLMEELLQRDQEVFWIELEDLYLLQDQVWAVVHPVESITPFCLGEAREQQLVNYDALLIRPDPPFDANYLHMTLILDHLLPQIVQINPAKALRNLNEKIAGLCLPTRVPATITTRNWKQMLNFIQQHSDVVIKPLDDCSGRGIVKISADEQELAEKLEELFRVGSKTRYLTAQEFIPEISAGDKRVFLVNGEPVGIVNRIPAAGNFLGNIHQGAKCVSATLTADEKVIIQELAPMLRENEVFMVGLDLIGGQITEINLTSPSAVRQINDVMGEQIQIVIVDKMLEHITQKKQSLLLN